MKPLNETLVVEILRNTECVEAAYLIGSAATNTMHQKSDVDIALLLKKDCLLDAVQLNRIATDLALACGYEFDLGIVSGKNLVYAYEVILKGKKLFCHDNAYAENIETTLLGMYMQFNDDRKEVIRAYTA